MACCVAADVAFFVATMEVKTMVGENKLVVCAAELCRIVNDHLQRQSHGKILAEVVGVNTLKGDRYEFTLADPPLPAARGGEG